MNLWTTTGGEARKMAEVVRLVGWATQKEVSPIMEK